MTPRERVRTAMQLGTPDQVPVMCQLATGHTLLNSGVDPIEKATTSKATAEAYWRMRGLYDFDGILMHKPGRSPEWLLEDTKMRPCPDGWEFVYPEGCYVRVQRDDDPIFFPAPGYEWPEIDTIDPENPLHGHFSGGYLKWHLWKATHHYHRVEDIPEYWYGIIDILKEKNREAARARSSCPEGRSRLPDGTFPRGEDSGPARQAGPTDHSRGAEADEGLYSLHGETRGPFDHVLNLLSAENMMIALLTDREKVHKLLEWGTKSAIAWSVAQIRRGCDAIKISSPWVGAGLISPEDYKEFVVPYETELAKAVRAEGGFIYTHTCGAISDRLEDMMSCGINGLECLDPPPLGNVELSDAVQRTRGRIFIKGNIDSVNTLLNKTPEGVQADVKRIVETGAPGGGYICSSACSVAPYVKPENIQAMVETARAFEY